MNETAGCHKRHALWCERGRKSPYSIVFKLINLEHECSKFFKLNTALQCLEMPFNLIFPKFSFFSV